jgi:hypothetical protein
MFKVKPLISALGISLLVALLCIETGCASAPKNRVIEKSPWLTSQKMFFPNYFEFGDALTNYFGNRVKLIQDEQVIAWAVKANVLDFPPGVHQEAIVMMTWTDETNGPHVTMAYFMTWGGEWVQRIWSIYYGAVGKRVEDRQTTPTASQIAAFIHETNFGYNEYQPRNCVEIWEVESYTNEPAILNALHGISDKERSRRFSNTMERLPN